MPDLTALASLSSALTIAVAQAAPSLVSVHSHRARATGFVWKSGLVISADEALADEGPNIVLSADGTEKSATIVGRDHTTDVALLRVDGLAARPANLTTDVPALGALAVIVGADHGTPISALAMISKSAGSWRSLRGGEIDARVELDTRLRRSLEGGLVLDATGTAIGMAVSGPRRTLVIPTATIQRVAGALETHGRIARGYLGVGLQPVKLDDGLGAMVMSVDKAGPAAAAGLLQGDIITAFNDEPVSGMRTLLRKLGPASVGTVIKLAGSRGGKDIQVSVTVGERPAS